MGHFYHPVYQMGCSYQCTARSAKVVASVLQVCYFAVIKLISGCVRIACSGLMITSLLQVINRLDMQVDCQDFLSTTM